MARIWRRTVMFFEGLGKFRDLIIDLSNVDDVRDLRNLVRYCEVLRGQQNMNRILGEDIQQMRLKVNKLYEDSL